MQREEIGYIDRIEDERFAVLLVDSLGKEFVVNVWDLPENAKEGSYLTVTLIDGEITGLVINQQETETMEKEISEKLQRIKSKSSTSKFKRK